MQENQTDRDVSEVLKSELGLDDEAAQRYQEQIESDARAQGGSILRKNRREIARLRKHAEGAVLENNFPAYKYAMEKLRDIYMQPYNDELIAVSWQTTRSQVWKILNDYKG